MTIEMIGRDELASHHFTPSAVTMMSMSLMPMNGAITPPSAVDQQVAAQQLRGADRDELHAAQRERDQHHDDQRVEDDRREDRRARASADP